MFIESNYRMRAELGRNQATLNSATCDFRSRAPTLAHASQKLDLFRDVGQGGLFWKPIKELRVFLSASISVIRG
jgi:hypothetical protein